MGMSLPSDHARRLYRVLSGLNIFMAENRKILVVEDNDFVRMQIVSYLNDGGYETLEASDGEAALDFVLSGEGAGLLIVDIRMEPVGGFDFVRTIRVQDVDTPVIFITGDQTTDILEQAGKLGVTAVLMKPVLKDRLLQTVARTMKQGEHLS